MKGTEKQIKWAEDIKRQAYATLDRADAQRGSDRFYTIDTDLNYLSPEATEALRAEFDRGFALIDSAAVIIDKREKFSPANIIKHGRDWMWHHGQVSSNGTLIR